MATSYRRGMAHPKVFTTILEKRILRAVDPRTVDILKVLLEDMVEATIIPLDICEDRLPELMMPHVHLKM
jgi:hypothetical protein